MSFPVFATGDVLNASDMNAVGLWLVKSQAVGSGISSVTVTDAFSADYDAYRIIYTGGTASATTGIAISMNGGPGSGYYYGLVYAGFSTTTVSANVNSNNAPNWSFVGGTTAGGNASMVFDLYNPFLTAYTTIHNGSYVGAGTSGTGNGYLAVTTSFTSFVMTVQSGTLTGGTIRVYGYKK
jgi:hypothetical protein